METSVPLIPHAPHGQHVSTRFIWVLCLSITLSGLMMGVYLLMTYGYVISPELPSRGSMVEFSTTGVPVLFSFDGFARIHPVSALPGFSGAPVTILESVQTSIPGDRAVLARIKNQPGTALGILHADNSFTPLLTDGTFKTDLAVRPDGFAMFDVAQTSTNSRTASSTMSSTKSVPGVVSPTLATSTASTTAREDAPGATLNSDQIASFVHPGPSKVPSRLKLINLQGTDHAVQDLGEGRSPRVAPDGFFIALAPEGLIRIDPVTGKRDVLVSLPNADAVSAAISPDGTIVALPWYGSVKIFSIEHTSPVEMTHLGSFALPSVSSSVQGSGGSVSTPHYPLGFVGDSHIVLFTSDASAALYTISTTTHTVTPSSIKLHIISDDGTLIPKVWNIL